MSGVFFFENEVITQKKKQTIAGRVTKLKTNTKT